MDNQEETLEIAIEALNDIYQAKRDEGLSNMCNWMRSRALVALQEIHNNRE